MFQYDQLIDYIPEPIKSVGGFKDKVLSIFKTNTSKETMYGRGKKQSKRKTQKKIRILFTLKAIN